MRRVVGIALIVAASAVGFDTEVQAATFQGIGELLVDTATGTAADRAYAVAISADGSTVVGSARSGLHGTFHDAFRWTATSGMIGMGTLFNGYAGSHAAGVSADGSVVVGFGSVPFGVNTRLQAYRWTQPEGKVDLGNLPGEGNDAYALAVSPDGSVVVGTADSGSRAYRWTQPSGMVGLGPPPPSATTSATAVSADGSVVVGNVMTNSSSNEYGFRWTAASGMQSVGQFPFGNATVATGVSGDGTIVVGTGELFGNESEAFRWTEQNGMVRIGDFDGGIVRSRANGISGDGTLIVGMGTSGIGGEAAIWDAVSGMRNLREVLVSEFGLGNQVAGWTLGEATATSHDGRVIIGYGLNPSGKWENWIADLRTEVREVHTIAKTEFSEPAIGAGTFVPAGNQTEMAFSTTTGSTGGASPLAGVTQGASSRIFTHRSVSATTTFETVDLSEWDRVGVSLIMQVGNTQYEANDRIRIYVTDGSRSIDLIALQGSADNDFLDELAPDGFVRYGATIPDDWTSAAIVISSFSNSSQASERYDFDRVEFRGILAVPEPSAASLLSTLLASVAVASCSLYRRQTSSGWCNVCAVSRPARERGQLRHQRQNAPTRRTWGVWAALVASATSWRRTDRVRPLRTGRRRPSR